jgi:hypothetical protein
MTTKQNHNNDPLDPSRRAFLTKISLATAGLAASLVGVPIIGFLLAPLFKTAPET